MGSGERILLSFWVGGMWTVGYVVIPLIFSTLDERATAALLAAKIFQVVGWVGVASATLLLLLMTLRQGMLAVQSWIWRFLLAAIGLMLLLQLWIQPAMRAAQAAGSTAGDDFAWFHGAASTLYLVVAVIGLGLVVFVDRVNGPQTDNTTPAA